MDSLIDFLLRSIVVQIFKLFHCALQLLNDTYIDTCVFVVILIENVNIVLEYVQSILVFVTNLLDTEVVNLEPSVTTGTI